MTGMTDEEKAKWEEANKEWERRASSGEPAFHLVIDLPLKISIGSGGGVQIDSPFAFPGFEHAGIQRTSFVVRPSMLRAALQALERNPGEPVKLSRKPSAL
jgi:hypothetical protein